MKIGDKWKNEATGETMILTIDGPMIYDPRPADEIIARARAFKLENDAGLLGHIPPAVKVTL